MRGTMQRMHCRPSGTGTSKRRKGSGTSCLMASYLSSALSRTMNQPPENRIGLEQNSDQQILRLCAASAVYARGKQILGLQATLTVLGGFASPIAVASFPQFRVWAAFYAFAVALLDALVLESLQSEQRQT